MMKKSDVIPALIFFFAILMALTFVNVAFGRDVTLAWDPNSEEDLAGYRIFCRQQGQNYDYENSAWEGTATTCTIPNLNDGVIYCFVARAFDTNANESSDSNEVCTTEPQPPDTTPPAPTQGLRIVEISVVLDNGDFGTSSIGTWTTSGGENSYGKNASVFTNELDATYTFQTTLTGRYEVFLWWTLWVNRCDSVQVDVYDNSNLLGNITINQQQSGGQWNTLGVYNFNALATVVINSHSEDACTTCADAIKFTSTN